MIRYNKIKNTAKNYLGSALVAGSLILGAYGCSNNNNLPINPETKQVIVESYNQELKEKEQNINQTFNEMKKQYNQNFDSTNVDFNESIKDRKFTIREQEKVYSDIKNVKNSFYKMLNYAEDNNIKFEKEYPNNYNELEYLLYINLNGFDLGTPKLEYKFNKEGLKIKVEEDITFEDKNLVLGVIGGILFPATLIFSLYVLAHRKKRA